MTLDRDARKQLLLTRIAFERSALRRDLSRVHQAASLRHLLRGALPGGIGQALLGASKLPGSTAGWLALALSLLRRYRTATTLLGGLAPTWSARRGWRRVRRWGIVAAALGAGVWFGWRALQPR